MENVITPLASAVRLALPRLQVLTGEGEPETRQALEALLDRALHGEDVDRDLLDVVKRFDALRRFVRGFVGDRKIYRTAPSRSSGQLTRDADTREWVEQPTRSDVFEAVTGEAASRAPRRHVNTYVAERGADGPWAVALTPAAEYEIRVHIGAPRPESLLDPVDSEVDVPAPIGRGVWLRAVLDLDDREVPVIAAFYLAGNGESFSCRCPYDAEHAASCLRSAWAQLPFIAPAAPAPSWRGRLIIYYRALALHVQEILLPIGALDGAPTATLVSRVTDTFRDLDDLTERSASVVLSEGTARLTVNGLGFTATPFTVAVGPSDSAALNTREVLYNIHLAAGRGEEVNRYDDDLSKPRDEFLMDLSQLARRGSQLFSSLFDPQNPDPTTHYSLPALLRHEALIRGTPPLVQVTDHNYNEHSVLWQTIYDLPLGSDPRQYRPCPSLDDVGALLDRSVAPALCPYDESHRGELDVLCPWGFWGFSTLLEQPTGPSPTAQSRRPAPMACLVIPGPGLAPLDDDHFGRIRRTLGRESLRQSQASSAVALAEDLADDDLDVAYFYCHCGYETGSPLAAVDRFLQLDGYRIRADDVVAWAQSRLWPRAHWRRRPPLVFLNGCHTGDFTSRTMNSFVPAFTTWANACGVIGTEITVHQTVANWIGEALLAGFWAGRPIAEVMRDARWQLLARGNVLGLAYTPYCLGDLTFRQR